MTYIFFLQHQFSVLDIAVIPAFVIHINLTYSYGIYAFCSCCDRVYLEEGGSASHLCSQTCGGSKGQSRSLDPDTPAPHSDFRWELTGEAQRLRSEDVKRVQLDGLEENERQLFSFRKWEFWRRETNIHNDEIKQNIYLVGERVKLYCNTHRIVLIHVIILKNSLGLEDQQ